MRKVTVSVQVEAEKLRAIQFYVGRKDSSVEAELESCIEKLYEKYVPGPTREYIESITAMARPSRSSRPPARTGPRAEDRPMDTDEITEGGV